MHPYFMSLPTQTLQDKLSCGLYLTAKRLFYAVCGYPPGVYDLARRPPN